MAGQNGENGRQRDSAGQGDLLARFSEEAARAGMEACRDLRRLMMEKPDMIATIIDTLPTVLDSWAMYQLSLADAVEKPDKIKEIIDNIPSTVLSVLVSIYGEESGTSLAVLSLIPASPLLVSLAGCGREEKLVEPSSSVEARLRAVLLQAQSIVYRVYFDLASLLAHSGEEENLWRPREMRYLYI